MTTLPEIIGAFVTDAFGLASVPGGSVAGCLVRQFFRRRAETARDLLLEELRRANIGEVQVASEDDAIAVIIRYLRAATEGSARLNLRLLAKVIAGKLRSGTLVADEFLQYAEALAPLSRDEIMVVGTLYKQSYAPSLPNDVRASADAWVRAIRELSEHGMNIDQVIAAAARAQRSGLIYGLASPTGVLHGTAFASNTVYRVSSQLQDLGKTVDFEDALRREAPT